MHATENNGSPDVGQVKAPPVLSSSDDSPDTGDDGRKHGYQADICPNHVVRPRVVFLQKVAEVHGFPGEKEW